jgi:hypothetical protein
MKHINLQKQFQQELGKQSGGTVTVVVESGPRKLTSEIVEHNSLAVSFNRLQLVTTELASFTATELERIGKALSARLTYLMEPIAPIEIDAAECVVQLRSNPPQKDDDGRTYYELLVRRGGEITLTRYRKEPASARQQVTATVTREVLLRLVGDFNAVLD